MSPPSKNTSHHCKQDACGDGGDAAGKYSRKEDFDIAGITDFSDGLNVF